MPFKLLYRGLEVTCDTIKDIDALADNLENQRKSKAPLQNGVSAIVAENSISNGTKKIEPPKIRAFVNRLAEKQKAILSILVGSPTGLTDSELRTATGVKNNMALAGITSVMSKAAKSEGLNYSDIVEKIVLSAEIGKQAYHYQITPDTKEELKNALNSKLF